MLSCFRAVPLVGYTAFHKGFYAMGHLPWWRSIHTGITQQFSLTPNCHTIAGRHLGRTHLCLFRPLPCHSIVLRFPDNPARVSCETNFASTACTVAQVHATARHVKNDGYADDGRLYQTYEDLSCCTAHSTEGDEDCRHTSLTGLPETLLPLFGSFPTRAAAPRK